MKHKNNRKQMYTTAQLTLAAEDVGKREVLIQKWTAGKKCITTGRQKNVSGTCRVGRQQRTVSDVQEMRTFVVDLNKQQ